MNVDLVWAEIAVAAVAGSVFYGVVVLVERAVTFWHPSVRAWTGVRGSTGRGKDNEETIVTAGVLAHWRCRHSPARPWRRTR